MPIRKVVKCDCGFVAKTENEEKLVTEVQKHAKEQHHINVTREQVLAMAQPDPGH
jgi:predicted small metal-binding protein